MAEGKRDFAFAAIRQHGVKQSFGGQDGAVGDAKETVNVLMQRGNDDHRMTDGVFVVLVDGGVEGRDIHVPNFFLLVNFVP